MSEESEFSEDVSVGWIQWFTGLEDHLFFCEVTEDFIKNEFNLYGLRKRVNKFKYPLPHAATPTR
jgi:casein kinase II subunit beta